MNCKLLSDFFSRIFILILILPGIACLGVYFGYTEEIKGIKLGVVNDEVVKIEDCFNQGLRMKPSAENNYKLTQLSCRFMEYFDKNAAEVVSDFILIKAH